MFEHKSHGTHRLEESNQYDQTQPFKKCLVLSFVCGFKSPQSNIKPVRVTSPKNLFLTLYEPKGLKLGSFA